MKAQMHKGWKIYRTAGGSNNGLAQLNAKHPLRATKLSATVPDNGDIRQALTWLKSDIDALQAANTQPV